MKLLIAIALAVVGTASANELDICNGVPHGTFIPDVSDCQRWFLCLPGGRQSGRCDDPWLFNPTTRGCDWRERVTCFTCPPTEQFRNLPVAGTCNQFISCIGGRASQHICQNDLHFNPATGLCDLRENVGCTITFTCPANLPPGRLVGFRSETNCSDFYLCYGQEEPTPGSCNPQLHFDPESVQCTHPNRTDCTIRDDGGSNPTNPPGVTTTTQAPFVCSRDGHHRHPTTCSSFVVCAGGTPHFFDCSKGLYFNPNTNQCDMAGNVNC